MRKFGSFKPPAWWQDFKIDSPANLNSLWRLSGKLYFTVYRGLSDAKFELNSKIARNDNHFDQEWNMARDFLTHARSLGHQVNNKLELLALAQHHGLPTRFMDVTTAFGVALYFATSSKPIARGAMVWCIDMESMPEVAIKWYERHQDKVDDLRCDYRIFPSLPKLFGRDIVPLYSNGDIDDEIERYMFETTIHPPILVAPPHISRRMTAQDAHFLLIDPSSGHLAKQLKDIGCEHVLRGIWLSPDLCIEVKKHLQVIGITQRLLFPDIDNLAIDIMKMYDGK